MVKTRGPLMSLSASGTVADALTYSSWKGRNYVRKHVVPANPQSPAQVGRRTMLGWLSKSWDAISTADKALWQPRAEALNASPFNAFLSENMENWHNFLAPATVPSPTRTGTQSDAFSPGAVWIENRIRITLFTVNLNDGWGQILFYSDTTPFDSAVGNTILLADDYVNGTRLHWWTPPSVQTWYFRLRNFTSDGNLQAQQAIFQATP